MNTVDTYWSFDSKPIKIINNNNNGGDTHLVHRSTCDNLTLNPVPKPIGFYPNHRHAIHSAKLKHREKHFIECIDCLDIPTKNREQNEKSLLDG